jgi:hypothetical protein
MQSKLCENPVEISEKRKIEKKFFKVSFFDLYSNQMTYPQGYLVLHIQLLACFARWRYREVKFK